MLSCNRNMFSWSICLRSLIIHAPVFCRIEGETEEINYGKLTRVEFECYQQLVAELLKLWNSMFVFANKQSMFRALQILLNPMLACLLFNLFFLALVMIS